MKGFAECDRIIEKIADEKRCLLTDMNGAMSGKTEFFSDHIHFNIAGSREAARFVAAMLQDLGHSSDGESAENN